MAKDKDPDSQKLWENFKKTEGKAPCKLCPFIEMVWNRIGVKSLTFIVQGRIRWVPMNFCPNCGRRIPKHDQNPE